MSECLNEDRLAETSDIATGMGITQSKLSRNRAYLIDHGIIASPVTFLQKSVEESF